MRTKHNLAVPRLVEISAEHERVHVAAEDLEHVKVDPRIHVNEARITHVRIPPIRTRQRTAKISEILPDVLLLRIALRQFNLTFLRIDIRDGGASARKTAIAGIEPINLQQVAAGDLGRRQILRLELVDSDAVLADGNFLFENVDAIVIRRADRPARSI